MQETMVIELNQHNPMHPNWVCFDIAGNIIDIALSSDAKIIKSMSQDRYIIVLLPMTDITLLNIHLPPLNKQRLQQALPFAVEEYLLQDVNDVHLAPLYSQQKKENVLPLFAIAHEKMQVWMQYLKELDIYPHLLTATIFSIPEAQNTISLMIENNTCLVRLAPYAGYFCDIENLEMMLTLSLKKTKDKNVIIYKKVAQEERSLNLSEVNIEEKTLNDQAFFLMKARCIMSSHPINLLQGRYYSRKISLPKGLLFKTLIGLCIVWVSLLLLYPFVSYLLLNRHLTFLEKNIATIYKKYFPKKEGLFAVQLTMEERIAQLTNASLDNQLMKALAYFGRALSDVPSVDIKHLNYTEQEMTLSVTASSAEDISLFIDKLMQQGLNMTQQNANLSQDNISVNLLVKFQ